MIRDLYQRLKAGETIQVQVPSSGMQFSIQPVYWKGIVLGWGLVRDGKPVPEYKAKLLGSENDFTLMMADLIEVGEATRG